jgi:hypothetical protein
MRAAEPLPHRIPHYDGALGIEDREMSGEVMS